MSNYKIVEDPTVVPEGVSVSETSKNGDSIIGIILVFITVLLKYTLLTLLQWSYILIVK
jgi:hypothetical protein